MQQEMKDNLDILLKKPRAILRGIGYVLSALIVPVHLKAKNWLKHTVIKAGIFCSAFFVLQPLSTFLLPRAEEVLKKDGIDPAVVQNLAPGKHVYVRTSNFGGKLHLLFSATPYEYKRFYDNILTIAGLNYAGLKQDKTPAMVRLFDKNAEIVYFADLGKTYEDLAGRLAEDGSVKKEFNTFLTGQQLDAFTRFHEIRHCSDTNEKLKPGFMREADADFYAIQQMAKTFNDTSVVGRAIDYLACDVKDPDHETSTYLKYAFDLSGKPKISAEEFEKAGSQASDFLKRFEKLNKEEMPALEKMAEAKKIGAEVLSASPLVRERIEGFIEARKKAIGINP